MKKYNIYSYKTDLIIKNKKIQLHNDVEVIENIDNNTIYRTIIFSSITNKIKEVLIKELLLFYKKINNNIKHILIIGIGNDNYTSDSIGPKTLKYIKVNYNIEKLGMKPYIKVSALEPGAFGETGILTEKIISSITKEIKPNVIILIDSYIIDNINYLNKSIELNNRGLYPGIGVTNINSTIDKQSIKIPIIAIGVPTAVEVKFTKDNETNFIPYILSTKDVDKYINNISQLIGESINESINYLSQYQDNND